MVMTEVSFFVVLIPMLPKCSTVGVADSACAAPGTAAIAVSTRNAARALRAAHPRRGAVDRGDRVVMVGSPSSADTPLMTRMRDRRPGYVSRQYSIRPAPRER